MNLAALQPSQREALISCVMHAALRRSPQGYRPASTGVHACHSTRAVAALVRAGMAAWTDGEAEVQPTPEGRALVADAAAATPRSRVA
jgi:hypothetical protein